MFFFVVTCTQQGQNDTAAHRGKAALGVFIQSKVKNQADETQRLTKHKDLTRTHSNNNNFSQRRPHILVYKGKEGLTFIDKRVENQQDTGETHKGNYLRQERNMETMPQDETI